MSNQDDHYFTRMIDVRQEIEDHVFPSIIKYLEEALKNLKGDMPNIDKLAEELTELEMRIKYLEGKVKDRDLENENDR